MGKVIKYVGVQKTIIVLEPDESLGPFLPLSVISDIGFRLIIAANTEEGRAAIQAAARGVNADITQLIGMSPVDTLTEVITPQGTANMGVLAAALSEFFPANTVEIIDSDTTVDGTTGGLLADATAAGFVITVPRTLGAVAPKIIPVTKIGTDQNPITIQDDAGAIKMVLVQGGSAWANITVTGGTVYVAGTP